MLRELEWHPGIVLYFAGSGGKPSDKLKKELSCNQLLSQLNEKCILTNLYSACIMLLIATTRNT